MKKKHRLNSSQVITFGFLAIIAIGAFLLSTPLASKSHQWTNFITSLFTSTSATCVTGLIVVDTGTYWSIFGQLLILLLIQVGGIGFMTFFALAAMLVKRKLDLQQTKTINQSSGAGSFDRLSVNTLIKRIIIFTFIIEGVGAILLSFDFIREFGWGYGIYYSIFTSISAFCNAGFELFGNYNSLTIFANNTYVLSVIMALIIIGGFGFVVWFDIFHCRLKWSKYSIHTKLVICATLILVILNSLLFLLVDWNAGLAGMGGWQKWVNAMFQSVTCRTAGFNSFDQSKLSNSGKLISSILMFIGGSPGSTAGGIKTTTLVILILSLFNVATKKPSIVIGKKRISPVATKQTLVVVTSYLLLEFIAMVIIMAIESENPLWTFGDIFFETTSAIGTVGLTTIPTNTLSKVSQVVLIVLMFVGRIGATTIILIFQNHSNAKQELLERPEGKVLIG